MKLTFSPKAEVGIADPMIYGHFLEHFHRQIYGGVYDPSSDFADEDGFRTDVLDALKRIRVPVIRWPGGCFVSSYDWHAVAAVNKDRENAQTLELRPLDSHITETELYILNGPSPDSYNDIGKTDVKVTAAGRQPFTGKIVLPPHSVCVAQLK